MSTNLIIGIIVGLAVVGGGAYVAMNPEIVTSITGGAVTEEETENDGSGASVGQTFAQLLALGQNLECTFSHDDGTGNSSSGTMYIADNGARLAGDFTIIQSGSIPMESHLIRADGYTYIWSDSSPQGVKSEVVNETELTSKNQNGGIDENTEFSCQAWIVNNSRFTLPTSIQFMDISSQIGASVEAGASIQAQQCAACNNLPAGAKEQCLAALAC